MNYLLILLPSLLFQGLVLLFRLSLNAGLVTGKLFLWASWPVWLLALLGSCIWNAVVVPARAHAGWLSWGPDPKTEAANKALERAAEIASQAAETHSSQHEAFLAAIQALSEERTHLAGHLEQLGVLASRDSAWASALASFGPVLICVAVLVLGCGAIWLVTRSGQSDSQLAAVLVDEVCGTGVGLAGPRGQGSPQTHLGTAILPGASRAIDIYSGSKDIYSLPSPYPDQELDPQTPETQEGELPF